MTFETHRLSFGKVADHYDRARPTYPAEAVAWATGQGPKRVVDLGAGTGKLTRVALDLGHEVTAVEPDPGMREAFERTIGQKALAGSAEEIPLPDGSVDAVIVGQAYHWFDRDKAHPEIARVLKPHGVFAPIWNSRRVDEEWTKRLHEIMSGGVKPSWSTEHVKDFGPLFTPYEEREFAHSTRQTRQGLADLVASRSHYLVASPERQAQMLEHVRQLAETLPEDGFEMPYTTRVRRSVRKPT